MLEIESTNLPIYGELMLPLLKFAAQDNHEHPIRKLRELLAQQLRLTPDVRSRPASFETFGFIRERSLHGAAQLSNPLAQVLAA